MDEIYIEQLLEKSAIRDFRLECLIKWGPKKSGAIIRDTGLLLQKRLEEIPPETGEAVRAHLTGSLLPALAYYQALLQRRVPEREAVETVASELRRTAKEEGLLMKNMLRLPFFFTIFRAVTRKKMDRSFPPEGWDTEWNRDDGREIAFTFRRCLYKDTLDRCGAAPLCAAFCAREKTRFSVLSPEILCICGDTLAAGDCCGFRLCKGKRKKEAAQDPN